MKRKQEDLSLLVDEVVKDNKKLRNVISLLYDSDMEKRFLGAKALGEIAKIRPELIKHRWGRIFYAFDDTMSCWGVAEGLGEIARNIPKLRGKIVLLLRKFQKDESSLQGFIWAMCRIGQVEKNKIRNFIPELISLLDSKDVYLLGQTIWALGELKISGITERIKDLLEDNRQTRIFENNSVRSKSIREIAEEAMEKLKKGR